MFNNHPYATLHSSEIAHKKKASARRPRLTDGVVYPVTTRKVGA